MNDLLDGGNAGGAHATVADVPSSNGTSMTFQLPASGWESGCIAVKRTTGNAYGDLSESHPFDSTGGGGGGGNDTVTFAVSDLTPSTGQGLTFSSSNAPVSTAYTIVYSMTDRSPFFNTYNGIIGTGVTTAWGTGSFYRVVPNAGAGRTVFIEAQYISAGVVYDSNTIRLDIL